MPTKSGLLLLIAAVSMGCAHPRAASREERHERTAEPRGGWTRLGERWVDGVRDRDVIAVGAREGRYRKIMIVVEHSALEMWDVVVTFGDGTRFEPATRHIFNANTRSHVIDLPGDLRIIRTVEFRYGNLPGGGRAQMELWAQ